MSKIWKKTGILALIVLMLLTCVNLFALRRTSASASVGPWIGKEENISAYGRDGIVFKSTEAGWANAYTGDTYNMNEGITIRFRVNSIPGIQGEVDAWFAFLLQKGVETTPLGMSEGFKFLFRESDPKQTGGGMAVERYIAVPNGAGPIFKTPLFSSVPMLGNEHYISIVQRRNGNGFLVSIDGVVTDYYADDDAFMIDDLAQGHVIVVANTPSGTAPWEVEIDKIQPLASTEAWEAFGTVAVAQSEQGLAVVESTDKSGTNSAIFYKKSVAVNKVQEVKLKIDACPSFTDEFSDAYVAVVLSKDEYATNINATDALIAVFKLKDRDTLLGNFGQGSMTAGFDKTVEGVKPDEELTVSFGFGEDGAAFIALNGEIVGSSKNIKENNFLGKQGYISIVTHNDSSSKSNWAYTVSSVAERQTLSVSEPEKNPSENNASGIALLCVGGVLALAAIGLAVFTFIPKKNKEKSE